LYHKGEASLGLGSEASKNVGEKSRVEKGLKAEGVAKLALEAKFDDYALGLISLQIDISG